MSEIPCYSEQEHFTSDELPDEKIKCGDLIGWICGKCLTKNTRGSSFCSSCNNLNELCINEPVFGIDLAKPGCDETVKYCWKCHSPVKNTAYCGMCGSIGSDNNIESN